MKMNKHFFKAVLLSISLVFASVGHVEAARLGGGKSIGKAPSAPIQKQATPAQKPVQQAQPAAPAAAPAAPAPAPSRFGSEIHQIVRGEFEGHWKVIAMVALAVSAHG